MPHRVIECILPIRWYSIHIEVKCELLYSGQDARKGAAYLRHRIHLPVQWFAIDTKTEFPNTLVFVIYAGTVLVENDFGNETSKLFSSTDEFSQVHKGKGEIKE
jgi:hypothetical protein